MNRHPNCVYQGQLVRISDELVFLRDSYGGSWPHTVVRVLQPFGSNEGLQRLPRPWTYDSDGNALVAGDIVAFTFASGNTDNPLILGCCPRLGSQSDAAYRQNYDDEGFDDNYVGARWLYLGDDGTTQGTLTQLVNDGGTIGLSISKGAAVERAMRGETALALIQATLEAAQRAFVLASGGAPDPDTAAAILAVAAELAQPGDTDTLTTTLRHD